MAFDGMHITVAYVTVENGDPKTIIQQGIIQERFQAGRNGYFPDTYVVTLTDTDEDIVISSEHLFAPDHFTDTRSPYYKKGKTDG